MYVINFSLLVISIAPFKTGTHVPKKDYTICPISKTVRKIYLHKKYTIIVRVLKRQGKGNGRFIKRGTVGTRNIEYGG